MKKMLFLLVFAFALIFTSCDKDENLAAKENLGEKAMVVNQA